MRAVVVHRAAAKESRKPGRTAKPIEDIKVGDQVWAWHEPSNRLVKRPVVRLFRHKAKPIVAVRVADDCGQAEVIEATTEHPFWVEGRGWKPASELQDGDSLLGIARGRRMRVVSVTRSCLKAYVFNFEVDRLHNYFVGRQGILVHNSSKPFQIVRKGNMIGVMSPNDTFGQILEVEEGMITLAKFARTVGGTVFIGHGGPNDFAGLSGESGGQFIRDTALRINGRGLPLNIWSCRTGDVMHSSSGEPSLFYAALSGGEFAYARAFRTVNKEFEGTLLGSVKIEDAKRWQKRYGDSVVVPRSDYTYRDEKYIGIRYGAATNVFLPVLHPEAVGRIEASPGFSGHEEAESGHPYVVNVASADPAALARNTAHRTWGRHAPASVPRMDPVVELGLDDNSFLYALHPREYVGNGLAHGNPDPIDLVADHFNLIENPAYGRVAENAKRKGLDISAIPRYQAQGIDASDLGVPVFTAFVGDRAASTLLDAAHDNAQGVGLRLRLGDIRAVGGGSVYRVTSGFDSGQVRQVVVTIPQGVSVPVRQLWR